MTVGHHARIHDAVLTFALVATTALPSVGTPPSPCGSIYWPSGHLGDYQMAKDEVLLDRRPSTHLTRTVAFGLGCEAGVRSQWSIGVASVLDAQHNDLPGLFVDSVQHAVGAASR